MEFTKHHVSPIPGELVLLKEIAVFANSSCNKCHGAGSQTFVNTSRSFEEGKRTSYVNSRRQVACTCALKRFFDKFSEDVEVVQPAGLRWKESIENGSSPQAQI